MPSRLTPDQLDPRVSYCVLRDPQMREDFVVSGKFIQQEFATSRDFKRFAPAEPLLSSYVPLDCGDFILAVWRDPSRPELNLRLNEPCVFDIDAELRREGLDPDNLPGIPSLLPPDIHVEDVVADLQRASRLVAESLYAQS